MGLVLLMHQAHSALFIFCRSAGYVLLIAAVAAHHTDATHTSIYAMANLSLSSLRKSSTTRPGRTLSTLSAGQTVALVATDLNQSTLLDSNAFAFTVSYPVGLVPSPGDKIIFTDASGTWGTKNVTVTGFTLHGTAQDLVLNMNYARVCLNYVSTAVGWTVESNITATGTAAAPLAAPALTGAATLDGSPMVKYDPLTKQLFSSTNANLSALMSPPVTNLIYTDGMLTSYRIGSTTYTFTYDTANRPASVSDGTTTQTLTYNSDGTIAGIS